MSRSLREIETLTRLVLDAELGQLRARSDEVARRRAKIEAMAAARNARAAALVAGTAVEDLAWMTGQDSRWLDWLTRERITAMEALAQAAARREAQRAVAHRAFGRVEAVAELKRREAQAARLAAARNAASGPQG